METYPQKKKKNVVGSWLDRFLSPSIFEFETTLTAYECYERLQKLPGKMVYLQAKGMVELANVSFQPFQPQWKHDANICEFAYIDSRNRDGSVSLRGKVFFSEIYETTLVQLRSENESRQLTPRSFFEFCALIFLLLMGLFFINLATTRGGIDQALDIFVRSELPIVCCASLFFVTFGVIPLVTRSHAIRKLLRIVLTEPDESRL
jgi:hypothetical protein